MAIDKHAGGFTTESTGTANVSTAFAASGAADAVCYSLSVVAKRENLGTVWIGSPMITTAANGGMEPGDVVNFYFDRRYINLSQMGLIVSVTGDGVDLYGNSV